MYQRHCRKPSLEIMKRIVVERLSSAEKLIKQDLNNSLINIEDTASFDSLHKVTDPNCYISDDAEPASGLEREHFILYETQDWIEYWQTLIEAVDAWLKGGMDGNIVDHLDDEILIQRF